MAHQGLLLRPFDDADAAAFVAAVRESVATVGRWMPWCHEAYAEQDALDWFALCRDELASGSAHEFGLFDARDGQLLGGAGLNFINPLHRMCNLGYWVRQSRQRQGVAARAVQALSAHAFGALGLQRAEIVVASDNLPSHAVARASGALWECTARNRLFLHGAPVAASVFSLVPPAPPTPQPPGR
ncbi:MAG: GNAT family protein [Burkholderiaceae bacterium]